MQSIFLEHRYWMLPVQAAEGTKDDMVVPLDDLKVILSGILDVSPPRKKVG